MSSEEVLLIVKNVKLKKSEGRLYMMGSRMAWMQASSDTFAVSHYYADIRGKANRKKERYFLKSGSSQTLGDGQLVCKNTM